MSECLAEAGPWLVALEPDHRFAQNMWIDSPAAWHLWASDAFVLCRSSRPLAELRKHLRRFTRLRRDTGDAWYYFRFWQADIMAALALRGPFELVGQLYAADCMATVLLPIEDRILELTRKDSVEIKETAPKLDQATWKAMGDAVERRFFHRLGQECVSQGAVDDSFAQAILRHLRDWGFSGHETIRSLALWWTTADGASLVSQPWVQNELAASRGMPDAVRADRLFNLAEDMADAANGTGDHATG